MFIIVNKDFSLANITPSTVYQGSNLANELAIFAPFSVSSYSAVEIAFMLPSGEYLTPSLAFPSAEQPDGFGVWSMLLPASVTAIPGTVRLSLSFIGAGNAKMVTEAAEFTVAASVPSVMPDTPSQGIYDQILSYIAEVLNRKPNWLQTNPNADDYIANKPPVVATRGPNGEVDGAAVDGDLIARSLTVGGVGFDEKLNKATSSGTAVYAVEGSTQRLIGASGTVQNAGGVPLYTGDNTLRTQDPSYPTDAVNLRYLQDQLRSKVLPTWVTNIATASGTNLGIPPTTSAIIKYASPAIIGQASGPAVLIDDASNISGQNVFELDFSPAVAYTIYGRNIINSTNAVKAATSYVGTITGAADGSITWSAGSNGAIKIPVKIPSGATFAYSFEWLPGNSSDLLGNIRFVDANGAVLHTFNQKTSGTATNGSTEIAAMLIYKNSASTALTSTVKVENLCVNIGTVAEFTLFQSPVQRPVQSSGNFGTAVFPDGTTIIPDTPSVVTVRYTRDSTKVINKIFELIAEIQDAIAN